MFVLIEPLVLVAHRHVVAHRLELLSESDM